VDFFRFKTREERVRDSDVDVDLKEANRRKTNRALLFIFAGIALALLGLKLESIPRADLPGQILTYTGFGVFVIGAILGHWAQAERGFLAKPEPKKPPSIWNWRKPR
jgi:hypothetical protein